MRYVRSVCLVILVACVFVPTAWSQRIPTEDELDEAIQTVKAVMDSKQTGVKNFKNGLVRARQLLSNYPEQSLGRVTALLDDGAEPIRLNAAIILAETAQKSGSIDPVLLTALKRCLDDQSVAVAYWGLQGCLADSVPVEKQVEAIEASLGLKTPRLVRLTAARLAGEKSISLAIPALVAHMQQILPSYKLQVDGLLTYEIRVDEKGNPLEPNAEPPTYTRKTESGEGARKGQPVETKLMTRGGGTRVGGGGPGLGAGARPGLGGASSRRGLAGAGGPGIGTGGPSMRRGPAGGLGGRDAEEEALVEKRLLDPNKFGIQEVVSLIEDLQGMPSVYELHEIGYIVETLARENPRNPREKPFGEEASFEMAPPWALAPCVEAAVVWLDENRAKFPNASIPVREVEVEETKETEETAVPAEGAAEAAAPVEEAPES